MSKKIHFIVNPNSGGGSVGKNWEDLLKRIEDKIGKIQVTFTNAKGHGSDVALDLCKKGIEVLVIIGGDGTISEVVDGIIKSKKTSVSIVVLNLGTGGDFSRSLGVPGDLNLALDKIKNGKIRKTDVGFVRYKSESTAENLTRYFINIIGCGMAGAVVQTVNKSSKKFGGFSYYLGSIANILSYQNKPLKFRMDGGEWLERKVTSLAICNGQYFGGGMRVSPNSELSDGYLDAVVIGDWNLFQKVFYSKKFYNGTITNSPKVESYRCKKIEIIPLQADNAAIIDCDGEDIGKIPMTIEVLPSAVSFLV
ncbi:MAG: diacylglycerol kinase family lipid kinase [Leptospiraceae bacterium]|nr:diacylglycerol kinase family lipid kinase [Leptospiraceae bacterium]